MDIEEAMLMASAECKCLACEAICVLVTEVEALRADAERYRWLRGRMDEWDVLQLSRRDDPCPALDEGVDAAIDAAMYDQDYDPLASKDHGEAQAALAAGGE